MFLLCMMFEGIVWQSLQKLSLYNNDKLTKFPLVELFITLVLKALIALIKCNFISSYASREIFMRNESELVTDEYESLELTPSIIFETSLR